MQLIFKSLLGGCCLSLNKSLISLNQTYCCTILQYVQISNHYFVCLTLLLSRFSHVQLYATPIDGSHQALPSLGFSRQEYQSGLPFPSPMHESEVTQSCPTPSKPHGLQPIRPLRPWDFPGKSTGVGCHSPKLRCSGMFYEKLMRNPEIYLNLAL